MNEEVDTYLAVTPADMQRVAGELFRHEASATLVYLPIEGDISLNPKEVR
jgi:hypothetical protein